LNERLTARKTSAPEMQSASFPAALLLARIAELLSAQPHKCRESPSAFFENASLDHVFHKSAIDFGSRIAACIEDISKAIAANVYSFTSPFSQIHFALETRNLCVGLQNQRNSKWPPALRFRPSAVNVLSRRSKALRVGCTNR